METVNPKFNIFIWTNANKEGGRGLEIQIKQTSFMDNTLKFNFVTSFMNDTYL